MASAGFALLLAIAIAAFWKPYLERLPEVAPRLTHLHAALMAAWCALLAVQPALVATGRRSAHRALGRSAWVLAPAIVAVSLVLAWQVTRPAAGAAIEPFRYGLFVVQLASPLIFGGCVAMALRHRRDAARHARWMVASGLSILDPVFARVFTNLASGAPAWLTEYGSSIVANAAVALLMALDRRGRGIYGALLAALVLMQVLWLWLPTQAFWRRGVEVLFVTSPA
ncbi:MAG: hypothetical protein JNJ89_16465 [Rubrivivax sp.]|nr:hypothetical protein [Rubrivivax sp.]